MLIASKTSDAKKCEHQVHVNGYNYTLRQYVGKMPTRGQYVEGNEVNDNGLPQGFLVYQPPDSVTPPHFHETNQFQVFVAGSAKLGKHFASPLTVQYANSHIPYGPIKAGINGVSYFTLRQGWDPGAKYMPQSRERLRKGNQRTRIKANIPMFPEARSRERVLATCEPIIENETDGLGASISYCGASDHLTLPNPSASGGQYLVVVSGTMFYDGEFYEQWSTIYVTRDEEPFEVHAGQEGLDLLLLQFPKF